LHVPVYVVVKATEVVPDIIEQSVALFETAVTRQTTMVRLLPEVMPYVEQLSYRISGGPQTRPAPGVAVLAIVGREHEDTVRRQYSADLAQCPQTVIVRDSIQHVVRTKHKVECLGSPGREVTHVGEMDFDIGPHRPHVVHHYRRVIQAYIMARNRLEKVDGASRANTEIKNVTAGEAGLIPDQRCRFDAIERVE
jgi:hypothetical protein